MVGAMSLEHARVDPSEVLDAEWGDEVLIVGKQGEDEITPPEVVARNGAVACTFDRRDNEYINSAHEGDA